MELNGEGRLLRIYIGESDHWHRKPLYEELVQAARRQGLAGATVLRGIEGFGAASRIHTSRILALSEVALDPAGVLVGPGDIRAQARQVFDTSRPPSSRWGRL